MEIRFLNMANRANYPQDLGCVDALREVASRLGATRIELVDGDTLCDAWDIEDDPEDYDPLFWDDDYDADSYTDRDW